ISFFFSLQATNEIKTKKKKTNLIFITNTPDRTNLFSKRSYSLKSAKIFSVFREKTSGRRGPL
ncbi:hypothetical protein, partial [Leptospira santarosai]|uniref:hypothetical protein n=1 Tax=Leptospira santarosai TaxID=28183 RepID=UPI001F3A2125